MEANQPKSRGGKRPGAGRKPTTVSGIAKYLSRDDAKLILAEIGAHSKWINLANSSKEPIVLETLKYLSNRAYGTPKQSIEHTGEEGGPVRASVTVRFVNAGGAVDNK